MNADWKPVMAAVGLTEIYEALLPIAKRQRGRWVAVCMIPGLDGVLQRRGARFTSKSKARKVAARHGGVVRRYRTRDWLSQPSPKVTVHTWVKHLAVASYVAQKG
jgi:hypothetical protein